MKPKAEIFEFSSYQFDKNAKRASFHYSVVLPDGKRTDFTELITFAQEFEITQESQRLLDRALYNLHLVLGLSYYKLHCAPKIELKTQPLTQKEATFWNALYTKGLGEFFYKNSIDFRNLINFPHEESKKEAFTFSPKKRALIGVGGGKDSIVAIELFKGVIPLTAFVVEHASSSLINSVIKASELDSLRVKRTLDTQLFDTEFTKNLYNGHIPISSIYAFLGIFSAILYSYKYVIVANESSSNEGNVEYLGESINHQWSKSSEFEDLFQQHTANFITPDINYFSGTRPLTEIHTLRLFGKHDKYFSIFSSCNRNFKISSKATKLWCGECPKCAFNFVCLAVYMPKQKLLEIFGKNLLEDHSLIPLFKSLLGVEGVKPFECVGTPEEAKVAFYLVHKAKDYNDTPVMQMFMTEILPTLSNIDELSKEVFTKKEMTRMPAEFRQIIDTIV